MKRAQMAIGFYLRKLAALERDSPPQTGPESSSFRRNKDTPPLWRWWKFMPAINLAQPSLTAEAWGGHHKDAGGVADISRWCKPPVRPRNSASPGRGDGTASRDFRRPGWGSDSILHEERWFCTPANIQCPFGHVQPALNSRGAMLPRGLR